MVIFLSEGRRDLSKGIWEGKDFFVFDYKVMLGVFIKSCGFF